MLIRADNFLWDGVSLESDNTQKMTHDDTTVISCKGFSNCAPEENRGKKTVSDSIYLAVRYEAKVILIEFAKGSLTVEQGDDYAKCAITDAVASGVNVVVLASNSYDTNILRMVDDIEGYIPTPDTGSVIVGGLTSDSKNLYKNNEPNGWYNHGATFFDFEGENVEISHGVDVSTVANNIRHASYPDTYTSSDGTSFASPNNYRYNFINVSC